MTTFLFFHAHPDDEAILTAGTMALAQQAGHRVVLVVATLGEEGEVEAGFLEPGQTLAGVRREELERAGRILGVDRIEVLGYRDSGMMGTATNDDPGCFWQADVGDAATLLAAILSEEDVGVLAIYDDNGGYGHPDHIMVNRVGRLAGELAGTPRVFEATFEREAVAAELADPNQDGDVGTGPPDVPPDVGKPAAEITAAVDVREVLGLKEAAMRAHPSQIAEDSWFLAMNPARFEALFGTEWYIQVQPDPPGAAFRDDWLL